MDDEAKKRKAASQARWYQKNKKSHMENTRETKRKVRMEYARRILDYLRTHPCACGESEPVLLEFDHVRGKKIAAVSTMIYRGGTWAKIEEEIAKCDVLCVRCHRLKTARERGYYKTLFMRL